MTLWAIVPVKPLRYGKSRLAGVLTEGERSDLNRILLIHTLDVLKAIPELEHVYVISRDPSALRLAREHGARTLLEDGSSQLNQALRLATVVAQSCVTQGVLIVPADLPLITEEDIRLILERGKNPPVVVIAPDRHRQGTNALLVSPPGLIEYEFGPSSFERHCERALRANARLEVCEFPSLALDMDLPEDLEFVSNSIESL